MAAARATTTYPPEEGRQSETLVRIATPAKPTPTGQPSRTGTLIAPPSARTTYCSIAYIVTHPRGRPVY